MKACPYCAEQIQDAAIKCRYCGSAIEADLSDQVWTLNRTAKGKTQVVETSAPPDALWKALVDAAHSAGLPVRERSRDDGTFVFESKGVTWSGWSGEEIFVTVSSATGGSSAQFIAKTKPQGILRLASRTNAKKWVDQLLEHLPQARG